MEAIYEWDSSIVLALGVIGYPIFSTCMGYRVNQRVEYKKLDKVRIIRTVDEKYYVEYWRPFLFWGWWCPYFETGCGPVSWPHSFQSEGAALSALSRHNRDQDADPVVVWESEPA